MSKRLAHLQATFNTLAVEAYGKRSVYRATKSHVHLSYDQKVKAGISTLVLAAKKDIGTCEAAAIVAVKFNVCAQTIINRIIGKSADPVLRGDVYEGANACLRRAMAIKAGKAAAKAKRQG